MMTNKNLGNCHFLTTSLDLNNLLTDYSKNLFFNADTYASIKARILEIGSIESQNEFIAITDSDPLTFITQFFAVILNRKTPVIISKKLSAYSLNQYTRSLDFDFFSDLKKNSHPLEMNQIDLDKKFIFFTSGTTGTPKAIVHNLYSLKAHMESFNEFFSPNQSETFGLNLPLNHVGGFMILMRAFFNGSKIQTVGFEKLDYLSLVPTQIERLINTPDQLSNLLNLKALLIGGAPLSSTLLKKLQDLKINFYETYGMTETLSFVTLNNIPLKGRKLELGSNKHIQISTPTLFIGHIENKTFIPRDLSLPYSTSDIGIQDELQNVIFLKRSDRTFKSGGEKVSLDLVNTILINHTNLKNFYSGSVPDSYWGERLVVLYNQTESINVEELKNKLKIEVDPFLIPKNFIPINFDLLKSKITNDFFYESYLKNIFSYKHINHEQPETLVIFHGFMENIDDFAFIEKLKCSKKYNILTINLPGHGNTLADSFNSLDDLLEHLKNFINFYSIKTHLVGYSLGGRVATLLALKINPISLTLISSSLGLKDENEKKLRYQDDLKLFSYIKDSNEECLEFFNTWYSAPLFGNYKSYPFYKTEIENKMKHDYHQWEKSLLILSPGKFPTFEENLEQLKKISSRKFYIYGELDIKYGSQVSEIKNIGFKISKVKDAYHNLHKTHQNELIDELDSFFKLL